MSQYNTVPIDKAATYLPTMIHRFAIGQLDPMIVADKNGAPAAALIPIDELRLLQQYRDEAIAAEGQFRQEVAQRSQTTEVSDAPPESIDSLAARIRRRTE